MARWSVRCTWRNWKRYNEPKLREEGHAPDVLKQVVSLIGGLHTDLVVVLVSGVRLLSLAHDLSSTPAMVQCCVSSPVIRCKALLRLHDEHPHI